ncbi:MAG: UPF0175 family protein [Methanosarcinales archaeon]|nr:MAG: UPF0175 family protein [Methanosarcinales archaeon]
MEWEMEELQKISKVQPDIVESALKELWERKPDLYKSIVISAYLDHKINLGKASELLQVDRLELQNELRAKGIPVRTLSREEITAEVEAARQW